MKSLKSFITESISKYLVLTLHRDRESIGVLSNQILIDRLDSFEILENTYTYSISKDGGTTLQFKFLVEDVDEYDSLEKYLKEYVLVFFIDNDIECRIKKEGF